MPLEGNRLSIGNALALCYVYGFKGGKNLVTAVCVMSAESARYTRAYNENLDEDGTVRSTDRGLFQINDRAHPSFSEEEAFQPRANVQFAWHLWMGHDMSFSSWSAYNSGRYLLFWPLVLPVWALGRWKNKVPRWSD